MSTGRLQIRHLSFVGPNKPVARVEFGPGLNLIYGASNTGKSFVVESIDFMLGSKQPLSDLPERVGYDVILLGVQVADSSTFTIVRSTQGGSFRVFEGLHKDAIPAAGARELADQHSERNEDNLSSFLLSKMGLAHKKLRKNKRGETQNLSMRNIARLAIVNEEEIIQKRSPLSDGNYVADTVNAAVFKLLLTGVDDSSLDASAARSPEAQSRGAQLDLLAQLIAEQHQKVRELAGPPSELEDQLTRLDRSLNERTQQLSLSESEYKGLYAERRDLLKKIEEGRNRQTEISTLLDRFELLKAHYISDIERLEAMEESGSLFVALNQAACPLCGADPKHQALSQECDGNIDAVAIAARAEIDKIRVRQAELTDTTATLRREAKGFERRLPKIEEESAGLSSRIQQIVAPNLRQLRVTYGELSDKRGEVREALALHRTLIDLEERKRKLESESDGSTAEIIQGTDLSTSTADAFSLLVLEILSAWHFPGVSRLHFDAREQDLVIDGKARKSFGKGLRAITQAAFTIGLLEYCSRNNTPHPGFAILDSPLLSYREPENDTDDLRSTDVNTCFYEFLGTLSDDRQVIIVENTDPPSGFLQSTKVQRFTGKVGPGRFGLFPEKQSAT